MNMNLCMNTEMPNNVRGLLGTPDGIKDNDWPNSDGSYEPIPKTYRDRTRTKAFDWCTSNWCVSDQKSSLFSDNKFRQYNQCGRDYDVEGEKALDSIPQKIKVACNKFAKESNNVIGALDTCLVDSMIDQQISGGDGL